MILGPRFGYYRVDTVQEGDFRWAVRPYTDIVYIGGVDAGTSTTPLEERKTNLGKILKRAKKRGFDIILDLEIGAGRLGPKAALKAARPYWDAVVSVVLGDEQEWSQEDIATHRSKVESLLTKLGLEDVPLGASFNPQQILSAPKGAFDELDFVSIWGYRERENEKPSRVIDRVWRMIDHVDIPVHLVMEAYQRSGWSVGPSPKLNEDLYWKVARGNDGVEALTAFAYGRVGGTKDFPEILAVHREIGKDLGL